jgi:hypothetical protein
MLTQEIPREEWVNFFNNFSRNHHGWTVNLQVLREDIGAQVETHELPLDGIMAQIRANGKDEISIMVEESPDKHLTHIITKPSHVRIERADSGADETLQIQSASGETTLLSFCCNLL